MPAAPAAAREKRPISTHEGRTENRSALIFCHAWFNVGVDRIRLAYTLKSRARITAANGTLGKWKGYLSNRAREGVLSLDATKLVPLESTAGHFREVYDDYVLIDAGHFATRKIEVWDSKLAPRFAWSFRVYDPGLWLFDAAASPDAGAAGGGDRARDDQWRAGEGAAISERCCDNN